MVVAGAAQVNLSNTHAVRHLPYRHSSVAIGLLAFVDRDARRAV